MTYNEDMLRNIEYLREKANVTYEEAEQLLTAHDGNVMRVLVELEHQGRVYQQAPVDGAQQDTYRQQKRCDKNETKERAQSFFNRTMRTRVVVERKRGEGEKDTIANLSVPFVVGATIFAPYIALASAGLTFVAGYQVRIKKEQEQSAKVNAAETQEV